MKIFTAAQTRELDAHTIENEPILSINLMERAATTVTDWLVKNFQREKKFTIFCGPGNNGGDGLAVARQLLSYSYKVEVYIVHTGKTSDDFKANEERLKRFLSINHITAPENIPDIPEENLIIDALFGSGLNKPAQGIFAEVIQKINNSGAETISIDIASGLFADEHTPEDAVVVQPTHTLTFQMPKLAFLMSENEAYTGSFHILDIGLDKNFIEQKDTPHYFTDKQHITKIVKARNKFSHKNTFGKVLIVAGSHGMMGAALLTSKACLRTGCGVLKAYVPECGYTIFQTALPEAMVMTDPDYKKLTQTPELEGYHAIGIGPGVQEDEDGKKVLEEIFKTAECPLVLDAGALNLMAKHKEFLEILPAGSVLTPHPGEFSRLADKAENDFHRLQMLKDFAAKTKSVVLLKGAYTAIATPEGKVHFNSTGNPGMATPGTGDALTGIITSLLAQGYSSEEAAIAGAYIHGHAGDTAAQMLSQTSMLAGDLIEGISDFFKDYER
ncbi:NAD(P)H-hydrate dehydratase [Cytophagaceae bacterium ABcell3]|nr:NAD(P)H-hydrate dehydratase [Cytophagaceae bacterium ABcell3]